MKIIDKENYHPPSTIEAVAWQMACVTWQLFNLNATAAERKTTNSKTKTTKQLPYAGSKSIILTGIRVVNLNMRLFIFYILQFPVLLWSQEKLPVFKQVTHPFMPSITSEYFFFSQDGLMWFSTSRGLTSFDGSDIVYYSSLQQSNQFGLSRISSMVEDKKHNFYIAAASGLVYYERKEKKFGDLSYTFADTHKQQIIFFDALLYDNNMLYAGSVFNGLFIYEPGKNRFSHYNLYPEKPDSWSDRKQNTVSSFASHATDQNKMWIGSFEGIYLFDKQKRKLSQNFEIVTDIRHKYAPPVNVNMRGIDIQRMDVPDDSTVWFNSWAGGFGKYNTKSGKAALVFGRYRDSISKDVYYGYVIPKFVKLSTNKYLLGIYNDRNAIYDSKTNQAAFFNVTKNGYPEEETRFVASDNEGNTWLLQRGLLYVSIPPSLRLQSVEVPNLTATKFSSPKLRGVYFDSSSHLFYSTFLSSSGVHVYDTNFLQQAVIPTSLIDNYYNHGSSIDDKLTKDGSNRLWTVGWKTQVLMPREKKFSPVERKLPSLGWLDTLDQFHNITSTQNGNILFRKNNGTIYLVNHKTLVADTISCASMNGEGIEIKDAPVWYDAKRNTIYLSKTNTLAQFNIDKNEMRPLPYSSLYGCLPMNQGTATFTLDKSGRIWFMIPKYGIRIIDPTSLVCIDSIRYGTRGLMRGDYTSIIGGSSNYILFRSQNGVVVYDFEKHQSFLFDHSNGLSSPDIKSFLYSNGYLVVGQSKSFEYFKLAQLNNYSSEVKPYLSTISVDSADVFIRTGYEETQTVSLGHNQNTLAFSISATEFLFPERIEYAYQLSPLEEIWHYTNYFNRKIIYSNLAPGKYRFKIKAQREGGNWTMNPVEYSITIAPAWWQTDWFMLLSIISAVGLVVYLIQQRIISIRKAEQQKSKYEKELLELEAKALRAQMNPHFIFNSLNSIKSLINKNENDLAAGYLTTFSKLIRTLFQNSDKREISLHEELETCKLYTQLEAMRFSKKIKFHFKIDEKADLKDIKVPALILQPFIENAIWHGLVPKESGGEITVTVKQMNNSIVCIVDDNGIGRQLSEQYKSEYEATHQSKGIGLTQSRLQLDKLLNNREDSIEIIDKKDTNGNPIGTTVNICFKI